MEDTNAGSSQTRRLPDSPGEGGALNPGSVVGRFRVEALLGQGGMGAVYRVWDPVLERYLALKAVRFGRVDDPAALERFKREAMALAQLNHRHVCQVHDWVEWEGQAFIAMELVEGQTLLEASAGADLKGKLRLLRAIARALEAAHAKGIVHRDLKPGNVMVDRNGQVRVLDFGLARFVEPGREPESLPESSLLPSVPGAEERTSTVPMISDEATILAPELSPEPTRTSGGTLTVAGSFMGSPAYASPEQMLGRAVGPASDLFSFGVLAWELLLGDHPFPGSGRERMLATAAGKRKSLRRRKLPHAITALLKALLVRDPAARPTAAQVVGLLDRYLKPLAVGWWIALSAAAALLVAGTGYFLFGRGIIADLARERPPRLAVMPVRNETGDAALDAQVEVGMTELLATALRHSPKLTVVDGESVNRTFTQFRLDPARAVDPDKQRQIARALGAALFLQGSLKRDPQRGINVFSYALVEPSGRVRLNGQVDAPSGQVFAAYSLVDPAVAAVLGKVDPLRSHALRATALPPEAYAQYAAGKALMLKGDYKGSEAPLKAAAYQAPGFALAVSTYASCLRRLGRLDQALPVSQWAYMASKATGDRWVEIRALSVIAFLAKDRGDLQESERLRHLSLTLAEATGDLDAQAVAINHLGLIAGERGREAEATRYYDQALALGRQIRDQLYISLALNNLANVALKEGNLARAAELYRDALAIQQEIGNRWGEALALNNLGVTALTSGNLAEAEGYLGRALALRQGVGDKAGQATCLRNLGILRQMRGDLPGAEVLLSQARDLAHGASVRVIEAECHFCLGEVQRLLGRLRPARESYQQTLDLLPEGVTPEIRHAAAAAQIECAARLPQPRLKELEARLGSLGPGADSPYTHRARAWIHHLLGRKAEALAALEAAKADPRRQAPEIQGELATMREAFDRR